MSVIVNGLTPDEKEAVFLQLCTTLNVPEHARSGLRPYAADLADIMAHLSLLCRYPSEGISRVTIPSLGKSIAEVLESGDGPLLGAVLAYMEQMTGGKI